MHKQFIHKAAKYVSFTETEPRLSLKPEVEKKQHNFEQVYHSWDRVSEPLHSYLLYISIIFFSILIFDIPIGQPIHMLTGLQPFLKIRTRTGFVGSSINV